VVSPWVLCSGFISLAPVCPAPDMKKPLTHGGVPR
jgi:hypothetical protein